MGVCSHLPHNLIILLQKLNLIIITNRYPVGISTEFCFRWQKKIFRSGEGKGIRGGKEKKLGN